MTTDHSRSQICLFICSEDQEVFTDHQILALVMGEKEQQPRDTIPSMKEVKMYKGDWEAQNRKQSFSANSQEILPEWRRQGDMVERNSCLWKSRSRH